MKRCALGRWRWIWCLSWMAYQAMAEQAGAPMVSTVHSETMGEFLLRHWYLHADIRSGTVKTRMPEAVYRQLKAKPGNFRIAEQRFQELVARVKDRGLSMANLRPDNVLVTYDDKHHARVRSFRLRTRLADQSEDQLEYADLRQYALSFGPFIVKLAQSPVWQQRIQRQKFDAIYRNRGFVYAHTLGPNRVRLAGVTPQIYYRLLANIFSFAHSHKLLIEDILIFGSRVCTRAEAVRLQPSILEHSPRFLKDDGVVKDSIRVSGMTSISDLQLRIFYNPLDDNQATDQWPRQLTFDIMEDFADFPVVAKFVQVPKLANRMDHYFTALAGMFKKGRRGDLRMQYASIHDVVAPFLDRVEGMTASQIRQVDRELVEMRRRRRGYDRGAVYELGKLVRHRHQLVLSELKARAAKQ